MSEWLCRFRVRSEKPEGSTQVVPFTQLCLLGVSRFNTHAPALPTTSRVWVAGQASLSMPVSESAQRPPLSGNQGETPTGRPSAPLPGEELHPPLTQGPGALDHPGQAQAEVSRRWVPEAMVNAQSTRHPQACTHR